MTHTPERTCIVCRKKGEKSLFFKLVCGKNAEIQIEREQKLNGRGAYICKNLDCINACVKTKALSRAFKKNVSNDVIEELKREFES